MIGWGILALVLGTAVVVIGTDSFLNRSTTRLKDCPQCLGKGTLKRLEHQRLAGVGTPNPKEHRFQVIDRYRCSNCYFTFSRNRLEMTVDK